MNQGWPAKNVTWMQRGKPRISYCAHPLMGNPPISMIAPMARGDTLLAQMLALETDDDAFTRIACKTIH